MTTDRDAVERLAPERIWLGAQANSELTIDCWAASIEPNAEDGMTWLEGPVEYVRKSYADAQLQAAVAEMREAAAEVSLHWLRTYPHAETRKSIALSIRALPAPTDALERAIEAAKREEREACAKLIVAKCNELDGFGSYEDEKEILMEVHAAIRARSDAQNKGV